MVEVFLLNFDLAGWVAALSTLELKFFKLICSVLGTYIRERVLLLEDDEVFEPCRGVSVVA